MNATEPRVWVLLGRRQGDNNQALALAEALNLPFETRTLRYNPLHVLHGKLTGRSLVSLTSKSRNCIKPPWPDLVIGIGRRSVPVARWIRAASKGLTKVVRIGHPRMGPAHFDLVITTPQYPVPSGNNVLQLPLAMSRHSKPPQATASELGLLEAIPRPHLLMAVGGATKYWRMPRRSILAALDNLAARAADRDGSLLVVGSQRTPKRLVRTIRALARANSRLRLLPASAIRFPLLLADADEIFVTGDSVSMLSEAVLTGKPVGLIPITQTVSGRLLLGANVGGHRFRDLRRLWNYLGAQGLIGTIDEPVSADVENPARTAASAVRRLLGDSLEKSPAAVPVDQLK